MTPKRPYLLRAFHDWLIDNEDTPYISVDAVAAKASVPEAAVTDGIVVLNISHLAAESLDIGRDAVSFYCRFDGVRTSIKLPMCSILAIYGKESGQGLEFDNQEYLDESELVAKEKSETQLRLV